LIKILLIKLLILSLKEKYIENIIVNFWKNKLKIFNKNKIKYNLYYISLINFDNIIKLNIVEIDINIKINILNTAKSFLFLFISIDSIKILLIL